MTSYGCDEKDLTHYTCLRTPRRLERTERLDKLGVAESAEVAAVCRYGDRRAGFLDTRMAALWDDKNLYVAFWIEEPNVQAQYTERDSPVYFENDVEVFIAGQDCYYEFQINARGTIYEVFYIWQEAYKKGGFADKPEFDLTAHAVDVLGGFQDGMRYKKHPAAGGGRSWIGISPASGPPCTSMGR